MTPHCYFVSDFSWYCALPSTRTLSASALNTLLNSNYFCILNSCCANQIYSEYGFKMCQCDYNANDSSRCENTAISMSVTQYGSTVHQFGLLPFYLPRYVT